MHSFVRVIPLSLTSPARTSPLSDSAAIVHCTQQTNHADVPIVNYMNAAHQQGYNANAMADADAELIDAADPPQLPAPRAQNPTAIATI